MKSKNCSVLFKSHFVSFSFYSCCETPKREDACCVTSGDIKEKGDWSKLQCEKVNSAGSLLSLLEIVVINIFQKKYIYKFTANLYLDRCCFSICRNQM